MMDAQAADGLNENDVIEAVRRYLVSIGYEVKQISTTTQVGDDIVATRGNEVLYVEAKGATSARKNSARFGAPFSSAQVRVHVAEAVYRAVQVLSRPKVAHAKVRAGIAIPANSMHRREVDSVSSMLRELEIVVFWVSSTDNVRLDE